jgi:Gpi18-like mannosyltransferase
MAQIKQFFISQNTAKHWFWEVVLFPFLLTRLVWEIIAYFSVGNFPPNPTYLSYFQRGFFLSRIFPIDIFTRWDSQVYFSIIKNGYSPSSDLEKITSNIAFFPLYPYLVKSVGWVGIKLPDGIIVALGVVLANLLFLISAALLYHLIVHLLEIPETAARRALALLFVFPSSFYFSCFYPESLFLLLALAGFIFGLEEKWLPAGICAALAVVTKAQGLVLFFALVWLYMEKRGWKLRNIKPSVLWFLLTPLVLSLHIYYIYQKTGRVFAIIEAQSAWGRNQKNIIDGIIENLSGPSLDVFKIDLILVTLFLLCSLFVLKKYKVKAFGIFGLLMCLMPLATGSLISISRFMLVIFPVFIFLGEILEKREYFYGLMCVWFALQIIYFSAWVNYYWIA